MGADGPRSLLKFEMRRQLAGGELWLDVGSDYEPKERRNRRKRVQDELEDMQKEIFFRLELLLNSVPSYIEQLEICVGVIIYGVSQTEAKIDVTVISNWDPEQMSWLIV